MAEDTGTRTSGREPRNDLAPGDGRQAALTRAPHTAPTDYSLWQHDRPRHRLTRRRRSLLHHPPTCRHHRPRRLGGSPCTPSGTGTPRCSSAPASTSSTSHGNSDTQTRTSHSRSASTSTPAPTTPTARDVPSASGNAMSIGIDSVLPRVRGNIARSRRNRSLRRSTSPGTPLPLPRRKTITNSFSRIGNTGAKVEVERRRAGGDPSESTRLQHPPRLQEQ